MAFGAGVLISAVAFDLVEEAAGASTGPDRCSRSRASCVARSPPRLTSQASAGASPGAKTRAAVVSLAGEDRRLAATTEQWDADLWLLNTPDGVVDRQQRDRNLQGTDLPTNPPHVRLSDFRQYVPAIVPSATNRWYFGPRPDEPKSSIPTGICAGTDEWL